MSNEQGSETPATRVAIVTGAAQGIGLSIALRLADDGLDVAVNDISSKTEVLNDVVKQIEAKGRRALVVPGDVSKEEDVQQMVEKTVEVLGGLDVVSFNLSFCDNTAPIMRCKNLSYRWSQMLGLPLVDLSRAVIIFGSHV